MNLEEFHHSIRAARNVIIHEGAEGLLVVMGSQSILSIATTLNDDRVGVALKRLSEMAKRGLPEARRAAWHRGRRQAFEDRLCRADAPSSAEILEAVLTKLKRRS